MKLVPSTTPTGEQRPSEETDAEEERWLRCAACGARVTKEAWRIEVNGVHEHGFMNPAGMRFIVGCFAKAECVSEGSRSSVWTWFPGYAWQIEACRSCGTHLGWSFHAPAATSFYGLIADRLVS